MLNTKSLRLYNVTEAIIFFNFYSRLQTRRQFCFRVKMLNSPVATQAFTHYKNIIIFLLDE